MRYDAVVIGAGMSGLAAGIRLAQAQKRVVVLERHSLWGGLNSFYKRAGRRFETGLHALTNYVPRGTPGVPLTRILRQLRIPYEALRLAPQKGSQTAVRLGSEILRLEYSNDFARMQGSVARLFPAEVAGFERMVAALPGYDYADAQALAVGARQRLGEFIRDPLLVQLLMIAPLFYGSPTEHDMSWAEFGVLFRSIHLEGMARPEGGIRGLLEVLLERYSKEGGELRMRCGVRSIRHERGRVLGVQLDDGSELEADQVFSSAGLVETRALCGMERAHDEADVGRLSFVEVCCVLDSLPETLGHDATIVFFSDGLPLRYQQPPDFVEPRCGVLTCPSNYLTTSPPQEGLMRLTCPARHASWVGLEPNEYAAQKERAVEAMLDSARVFAFDPRPHTLYRDAFTPRTIEHFTGHRGGAVYGSPRKSRDGRTELEGLSLIGTDQGLVGVVGTLLSGIGIVNQTVLRPTGGPR